MKKKSDPITQDQYAELMKAIREKDRGKSDIETAMLEDSPLSVSPKIDDIPLPPAWARGSNLVNDLSDDDKAKLKILDTEDEYKDKDWRKKLKRRDRRKLKKKPETSYLVTLLFSNGTKKTFVVVTTNELFSYRKKFYHLRYEDAVLNLNLNLFELAYDEDYVEPIGREIKQEGDKAFFSVKPDNVKPLIDMNYVKVLVESQDIQKLLKLGLFLAMINAVLLLVLVFFQLKESGVINF